MAPTAGSLGDAKSTTVIASPKSPKISLKERKKRTSNPGIRQQGGRIYDSENGTTCHQCRQKTIEIKAKCKQCTLYYCPRCLENRYNEAVAEVNAIPDWSCPRCRKSCNCSNCRKKAGLEATGILAKVAKTAGFGSVSELLKKNPQAQAFHLMTGTAAIGDSSAVFGSISRTTPGRQPKSATKKRKVQAEEQLLDDSQLSPRKIAMPQGAPIALHKRSVGVNKGRATSLTPLPTSVSPPSQATPKGGAGSAKRQRGPAWLDKVPHVASLPTDIDPGQIACILEFISVFGTSILNFRSLPNLTALATELVQPATTRRIDQVCPVPEDSLAAMVHMKLLDVVRHAWEVRGPPVRLAAWQQLMRPYYAAEIISPAAAAVLQYEDGPSAVSGELFARRVNRGNGDNDAGGSASENEAEDDPEDRDGAPHARELDSLQRGKTTFDDNDGDSNGNGIRSDTNDSNSSSAAYVAAAAAAAAVQFPKGGFWGIAPGLRIQMLYTLLHDALDTYTVRQVIEKSMENAAEEERGRRGEVADVRRAAKEAATKQRDQEIALLVAAGGAKQMTLEEQRSLMNTARQKAETAATAAAAAKLRSLSQVCFPPTVRSAPLGQDRDGNVVFKLQTSAIVTGNTNGLVFCGENTSTTSDAFTTNTRSAIVAQGDPAKVVAALDPRGKSEGPLRHAIAAACKVSLTSPDKKKRITSPASKRKSQITTKSPTPRLGSPAAAAAGGGGSGGGGGSKRRALSGTPKIVARKKTSAAALDGKVTPVSKAAKSVKK